jgi:CheY-like chemotaxis protein
MSAALPTLPDDAHTILVVEDDAGVAQVLEEMCASLGYRSRRAPTLAAVRDAIGRAGARGGDDGFCGVLLDLQLPADDHARPLVGSGETALALFRKHDKRRNPDGFHTLPIVAITGYSVAPDFVARLFKAGIDEFIPRSFDDGTARSFAERIDAVLDKIRTCLAQAGRAEHAACARLIGDPTASPPPIAAPLPPPQGPGAMTLELRGDLVGRRAIVLVNGQSRELQGRLFVVLLRLALQHEQDSNVWLSFHELGVAKAPDVPKRIRDALNPVLPAALDVLDTKYGRQCRLHPDVHVVLDRARLAEHADPRIAKLIRERARAPRAAVAG